MTTRVRTGWAPIPHLAAQLRRHRRGPLHHVLGARGLAGTTARWTTGRRTPRCSRSRGCWRAGGARSGAAIRLAFWSGHSHGRYAGSAWYADHAWMELHRRCAVHLNIDSTGARGATDYSVVHATEDAQSFVEKVVHDVTGQTPRARRFSRAGDQSFWGIGVPSALMSLSGIPKQDTDLSRWMERLFGTAGFPWWWHTREDTIDKIDADVLALDTRVYVASALRSSAGRCCRSITCGSRARSSRGGGAAGRGGRALGPRAGPRGGPRTRASGLRGSRRAVDDAASGRRTRRAREAANRALMRRLAGPGAAGLHDRRPLPHDLAIPMPPLAGLQRARELSGLDPTSDGFQVRAGGARPRAQPCRARPRRGGRITDAFAPEPELSRRVRAPQARGAPPGSKGDRSMSSWWLPLPIRAVLAVSRWRRSPSRARPHAQKRGGTLTIVRPDRSRLARSQHSRPPRPARGSTSTSSSRCSTLDEKMQIQPTLATSLRGDVARPRCASSCART